MAYPNLELNKYLYQVNIVIKDESKRNDKLFSGYSINQLRNLKLEEVKRVQEFYCNVSGKTGYYKYDSSDVETLDDCGYCLVTKEGLRLKRNVSDRVLYTWFEEFQGLNDHTGILDKAVKVSTLLQKPLYLKDNATIIVNKKYQLYQSLIGNKSTIKLINNSTIANQSCILDVKSDKVSLSGFTIDGNRLNNLGLFDRGIRGVYADRVKFLTISNVKIFNTRDIGLLITNCPNFTFRDSEIDGCGRFGAEMATAQYDRIGCLIDNYYAKGTEFYMSTESIIDNVEIKNCGLDGLVLGVGLICKRVRANYNGLEFAQHDDGAAGIYVRPPQMIQDGIIDGLSIIDCEANHNTGFGIDVGNNAGSLLNPRVTNLTVSGCKTSYNYLHGIGVASVENGIIRSNISYNNGTRAVLKNGSTNVRRAGIGISCIPNMPFKNLLIENNQCYDTGVAGAKTQLNGLWLSTDTKAYSSENLFVQNNDFSRNEGKFIAFGDNSPVTSTSILSIINNQGGNSYTVGLRNNGKIQPVNPYIYLNVVKPLSLSGIDNSTLNNVITVENVSPYDVTLINSYFFRMLGNENLVLKPNKPVKFIQLIEKESFVWKQIPNKAEIFFSK